MPRNEERIPYEAYLQDLIAEHQVRGSSSLEWRGHRLNCGRGVFNPALAPSSILLADYLFDRPLKGGAVLDAGCGCGLQTVASLDSGADFVLAFDRSEEAVASARRNVERAGYANQTHICRTDTLPEEEGDFDWIVCNPPFFDAEAEEEWHRGFVDPGRQFLRHVLGGGAERLASPDGRLILVSGGSLTPHLVSQLLDEYGYDPDRQRTYRDIGELDYTITEAHLRRATTEGEGK